MGGEESELGVVSPPQWKRCRCQRQYFSPSPAWLPASSSSYQMIDLKCSEETEQTWACPSRLESALCLAHKLLYPLLLVPSTPLPHHSCPTHVPPLLKGLLSCPHHLDTMGATSKALLTTVGKFSPVPSLVPPNFPRLSSSHWWPHCFPQKKIYFFLMRVKILLMLSSRKRYICNIFLLNLVFPGTRRISSKQVRHIGAVTEDRPCFWPWLLGAGPQQVNSASQTLLWSAQKWPQGYAQCVLVQ